MTLPDLSRSTLDAGLRIASSRKQRGRLAAKVNNLAQTLEPALISPQPFLKWAGGKRALLAEIRLRTPNYSGKYIEPFLGAGALLFDQAPNVPKVVSDYNRDLVEVYEVIRDDPDALLAALRSHVNNETHYYNVRAWDRAPDWSSRSKVDRAARFIYLNKTNYNGLYRVNASGQMNVPFGGQANPDWIQSDVIASVSDFLNAKAQDGTLLTTILTGDYRLALAHAGAGDWVYLDPPYADTFNHYVSGGFTVEHQTELRDEVLALTAKGVPVLLSNSDVPLIRDLYGDRDIFHIDRVQVRRAIGATVASRGNVDEVMVNNYRAVGV
jgi:DNA adenine methylase